MMCRIFGFISVIFATLVFSTDQGLSQDSTSIDLSDFSLEELLDVKVVSISRKSESIQSAAAAVFVISANDIRRSGAHSIPEVLRLAPGLNVARINASSWAITSRGFNSRFANKLQVLVDGRSVYSPMFSGVYWEDSSVMLEDIERIEIIRGPGATMWGANAVNGVINIITQKPEPDDASPFVSVMTGNQELFRGAGRVGGKVGDAGTWRLSAQYKDHGSFTTESGRDSHDAWNEQLVRVRWDHQLNEQNSLTVSSHYFQGDMENQYLDNTITAPYSQVGDDLIEFNTASLQAIWTREISQTSGLKLGLHATHFENNEFLLAELHNIVDVDFQHNFNVGRGHSIIWGGNWRYYYDHMHGTPAIFFDPDSVDGRVFSTFAQDDWEIVPDKLHIVLGGKWEYRKDTGSQWQPSIRTAWTPSDKTTWWSSVARAVRVPSRINRHVSMDMTILPPGSMGPGSPATSISMIGTNEMIPEELIAYETGFRFKLNKKTSLDLALFVNEYDNLRVLKAGSMLPHPIYDPPTLMFPLYVGNGPGGRTQGGELAANWKPTGKCQFHLAYSYWDFKVAEVAPGESSGMERMATPKHQVSVRGLFNPLRNWEADIWYRATDDLMADPENMSAWTELDLRVSWTPVPRLRWTVGGRNLLHQNHQEFIYESASPIPGFIERSHYMELQWSF